MNTLATSHEFQGLLLDDKTGSPIVDAQVEVWDSDGKTSAFVQGAKTDNTGAFVLRFSSLDMPSCTTGEIRSPVFRVYQRGQAASISSGPDLTGFPVGVTRVNLKVTALAEPTPPPPPSLQLSAVAFPVTGRVATPAGHPVAGVKVEARMEGEVRHCGEEDASLLGHATTDIRGRFDMRFLDHPTVLRHLRALSVAKEASFSLTVMDDANRPLATAKGLRAGSSFPVTLTAEPEPVEDVDGLWGRVAPALAEARIAHIHHIAAALADSRVDQPMARLTVSERAELLADLEGAFLDPNGVLRRVRGPIAFQTFSGQSVDEWVQSMELPTTEPEVGKAVAGLREKVDRYDSLDAVDWVLDLETLANKGAGPSISLAESIYVVDANPFGLDIDFPPPPRILYRNYLRAIFTGATESITYPGGVSDLNRRLKQDFETEDDDDGPANALLVNILKAILVAPTGDQYGFGMSESGIESQGNRPPRQYLDYLIGLTGLPVEELSRRYRLDFSRGDDATSSPVRENVAALQGFYRDGFQSKNDPFPIYHLRLVGRAPFFLYFEEWLRARAPFFGENHFSLRDIFRVRIWDSKRDVVREMAGDEEDHHPLKLLVAAIDIEDKLAEGWLKVDQGEYAYGLARFREALRLAEETFGFWTNLTNASAVLSRFDSRFQAVRQIQVSDAPWLLALHQALGVPEVWPANRDNIDNSWELEGWITERKDDILFAILHLVVWGGPALEAEVAMLQGDLTRAAILLSRLTLDAVGRARFTDVAGYRDPAGSMDGIAIGSMDPYSFPLLYGDGELPYTLAVSPTDKTDGYLIGWDGVYSPAFDTLRKEASRTRLNRTELRALRLRLCEALLGEAGTLYRRESESDVARARELYKAVLFIHKRLPPISPTWGGATPLYSSHHPNPVVSSQLGRALSALLQIEEGLNFYGFRDDLVPSLRYRTLKDTADRLGAAARSAQQDFLFYTGKVEEALKDELTANNLLQKANLQQRIAKEQEGIAEYDVVLAQQQVAQVQAAIEAKRKEIEEHDDLFTQFKDFLGGMKGFVDGLMDDKEKLSAGVGLSSGGAGGTSALAAGGAVMGAYAAFVYAGITTLQSMADAQLSRQQQLKALKETALPLAQAGVKAKQREIAIAKLQQQVAAADLQFALSLLEFGRLRVLNAQLWHQLAEVARRVLSRYLELGGRFAWQAERALAYEQGRALDIIRLSYSPEKSNGLTGADLLQADLAELEAARLMGQRRRIRARRTYSLAFDFPMAFTTLKQTGRASFSTTELELRGAHPGSTGWRISSVSTAVQTFQAKGGVRGLLTNLGFSRVSQADASLRPLLRSAEGQPLGEPLTPDRQGESLAPFEGGGMDTFWTLDLPTEANPFGLDDLMDIFLTFEVEGDWSAGRYAEDLAAPKPKVRRFVLFSATKFAPEAIESLKSGTSSVTVQFDVTQAGLPIHESGRVIKNLAVAVVGVSPETFTTPVSRALPSPLVLAVPFHNAIAHSNAEPFNVPGAPAEALNAFVGNGADQTFTVTLGTSPCPGVDFSKLKDVILALEYEADIA